MHSSQNMPTYQWLETKNPKSRAFITGEKQRFDSYMGRHRKLYQKVAADLKKANNLPRTYMPNFDDRYLYYWMFTPGQEQSSLFRQDKTSGETKCIFDPHEFDASDTASIVGWAISPNGRMMAFSIAYNGGEESILYIKNIDEDRLLLDTLPNAAKQFAWGADDKTLFYVQIAHDRYSYPTMWAHTIGRHPSSDSLVFNKELGDNRYISLAASDDHRHIEIYISRDFDYDDIYLFDVADNRIREVTIGEPAATTVFVKDGFVYARTNLNAPKHLLCRAPLASSYKPLAEWDIIVPETDDILEGVNYTKSYVVLHYLHNAASKTVLIGYDGQAHYELPLAPFSYVSDMSSHISSDQLYYEWQSFTEPPTITRFDAAATTGELFFKEAAPSLGDSHLTEQHWYQSGDGTSVPLFLTRPKNVSRPTPLLLSAYGGFSTTMTPDYIGYARPLVEAGFSFALANIRGGSELGEQWHTAATGKNRQRSFDDFIAAAEYLQQQNFTTAPQLAVQGGSNGGLLVAACMVQRPELFGAVVCEVPLIDMLRFHLFDNGNMWIPEYGDPDEAADRAVITGWSPLEHIRADVTYPPLYVSTGDNDTRVSPHHAYKFVAKLRDVYGSGKSIILLRNNSAGGHGGGSGVSSWINESAGYQTFLLAELKKFTSLSY